MSFKFMKLVVDWDGVKYNNRLELGDESDTPVDLRFKVPGYIENVHTVFFQNYSSETNVPRIYGDATNLVFYDNHDATNRDGVKLADLVGGMGESLWESSIDGETYLTTPEHINLKGYALRGSNVTGGNLLLVANSVDVGKILCNDMLDVQNNDIVNINSINGRDAADLVFYGATQTQNGTDEFMRWKWDGQKLVMNNTLDMGGNGITNVGGITMSDAINMGGNGISNAYVIKANGTSGVEFRPYNYAASGDELLNIAWNGLAFVAGANASMDGNDLSYVKAINGTTTTSLQLNFCGNDPATHEIWRVGDDIKFKDVHTGTKTLFELASGGGSSTFTGLSDTPPDYTGAAGKFVKVSNVNTLEFVAGGGGESLWESPTSETYLTTPEPINLKGHPLRGSNVSGGDLLLVANSVDSGTIYCQDMLDVQGNDIDDIGSLIFRTSLTSAYITFDTFDWLEYDCNDNVYKFCIGASPALSIGLESISCGADIDMGNRNITGPSYIKAFDVYGIDLKNSAGITRGILAHTNYALQCEGVGINMNGENVECVDVISGCGENDLRFYDDVVHNFVTLSQLVGGGSGESLWEDMGTYVQLIQDDHLSMRSKNITNLLAPVYGTDAANKDYVDGFLPLSGGSSHPMTDDLYMGGHSIRDVGARYGKLNTLQQWYYNSSGGGVVKKMELNAITMNMFCPLNMNGSLIDDVDTVKANDAFGVKFKQSNTDNIRLYVAWAGYAFVANANANMNTHNIINVTEISGVTGQDIYVKPLGDGILYLG